VVARDELTEDHQLGLDRCSPRDTVTTYKHTYRRTITGSNPLSLPFEYYQFSVDGQLEVFVLKDQTPEPEPVPEPEPDPWA
jgi:hypothetical protein